MSVVEIRDLVKQFSDRPVVNKLSLSVSRGEILALLGSSGCGKTTTLRCIAGLESPTSGEIWIDGVQVAGGGKPTPAERRNIGMVFQSYAIWPHMTVAANVAYGLRLKKMPKARIKEAVAEALSLVMLDGLGDRYPSQLSGGQQQRVALARSIVTQPAVLLLDEPLSNLDAKMREQMRGELREVIKRTGITAIHITHDQAEAMAVADRIGVMHEGTITQIGSAREIYRQPNCRFVAGFVGRANFIPARVTAVGKGELSLTTDGGLDVVAVPVDWATVGDNVLLAMRPEDYRIVTVGQPSPANCWPAKVSRTQFLGPVVEYLVQVMSHEFQVSSAIDVSDDQVADISISPDHIVVLPADADADVPAQPDREGRAGTNVPASSPVGAVDDASN